MPIFELRTEYATQEGLCRNQQGPSRDRKDKEVDKCGVPPGHTRAQDRWDRHTSTRYV